MFKTKKRYAFWRVFWVVLGLNIIFTILGFIALSVSPMYSQDFNWNNLFTSHYLLAGRAMWVDQHLSQGTRRLIQVRRQLAFQSQVAGLRPQVTANGVG